jgi:hypothetical protein
VPPPRRSWPVCRRASTPPHWSRQPADATSPVAKGRMEGLSRTATKSSAADLR